MNPALHSEMISQHCGCSSLLTKGWWKEIPLREQARDHPPPACNCIHRWFFVLFWGFFLFCFVFVWFSSPAWPREAFAFVIPDILLNLLHYRIFHHFSHPAMVWMAETEQSSQRKRNKDFSICHHFMISHLFKDFICATSRLSGEGARMGFTEFQRYFGSSAVPHVFCLPSLSSLHPPHQARCQSLHQQAALPSGFQLSSTKGGGHWQQKERQESKVMVFISEQGHFKGLCSCQVTLSIYLSLFLGSCNDSLPWVLQA